MFDKLLAYWNDEGANFIGQVLSLYAAMYITLFVLGSVVALIFPVLLLALAFWFLVLVVTYVLLLANLIVRQRRTFLILRYYRTFIVDVALYSLFHVYRLEV
ncbi:MAG: hypothetical protein A3E37_00950 [Candidatus Andersenbacteria bacterium RIFCSPHIGHO2_12_FULL_46_9]|nr:MAG: hypothetical protein UW94_C0015G0009 [Parcubacteria group bacterium GW2011_GWA2_45_14]OGY33352.1 MAG: hypothetical protein A3B76_02405 [Candidatus Andersenbacteria bacterium RIFCSPHIGHO2_02_FULL_46_16]OGY35599.1 MAG: hypothetical protein A3E37_00950 [Candidatus Andersenbacteria bacterium RIFCSPHIGHO2_12_FULL_46_9]OGY36451.1 MAG: hypothetical protein A3I08_01405 [Candidatus Andersenbacteria bacterium RIFCSPLOWO2_02_FULL_46_11]OGY38512.1 MAG: hypothetical protein A3G57_00450 [Candidatus A